MTDEQLDRIADLVEQIRDAVVDDETPPAGGLRPPTGFTANYDRAVRKVASRWTGAPGAVSVQSHERLKDPAATLKATVPAATGERVSSELAGGRYEWALRSVGPDGELSDFTEWIATGVPPKGEDDEPEEPGEEEPPPAGGPHPTDILPELKRWTITLPTGSEGDPDNDYMIGKSVPGVFFVGDHGGVVFRANAGGATTANSDYPRAEGRQMRDDDWTKEARPSSEPHTLECDLAIDTRGLRARRRISAMQIHDGGDDVVQLIFDADEGLGLSHDDGDSWELIDPDYRDGTRFTCRFVTVPQPDEDDDRVQVFYNDRQVVDILKRGSGWYDKVGAYLQTAPKWGEADDATGEVVVWRLVVNGGSSS
jgi:poly(beta-D-mannuronate) lyase